MKYIRTKKNLYVFHKNTFYTIKYLATNKADKFIFHTIHIYIMLPYIYRWLLCQCSEQKKAKELFNTR